MTKERLLRACRENGDSQLLFLFKLINHSVIYLFFALTSLERARGKNFPALAEVGCVSRRTMTDSRGRGYLQIRTDSEAGVKPAAVRQLK